MDLNSEFPSDEDCGRVRISLPSTPFMSESDVQPPSYTTTTRMGWPMQNSTQLTHMVINHDSFLRLSSPFFHPPPPPSYSESEFYTIRLPPNDFTTDWGSRSQLATCPRCGLIAMTLIKTQCAPQTHYTCMALCCCACWPCCLLPYFLRACKITQHICPRCDQMLGMHNPWKLERTCQTTNI